MIKIKSIDTHQFSLILWKTNDLKEIYGVEVMDRKGGFFVENLDYKTASIFFDKQIALLEGH